MGTLCFIAKELNFKVNKKHEIHFKSVKNSTKENKDDRLLVSCDLLLQLYMAAMAMFNG